ncbi:MAG: helix-turn-helix domain-containing protein [Gemmatimonadaceae bacterium]|nr:helix-turn-helix domain-containing protein [Gemmatimonadaceae bacterium]
MTTFKPDDVKTLRGELGQSLLEFALMIGVSVSTLRNWAQGRRTPDGPALALLRLTARNPEAVVEALNHGSQRGAALQVVATDELQEGALRTHFFLTGSQQDESVWRRRGDFQDRS